MLARSKKVFFTTSQEFFKHTEKVSGPRRLLSLKDELILTLMKLRLGSLNVDLAIRFQIWNNCKQGNKHVGSILGKGAEVPNLQSIKTYCFAAIA